MGFNCRWAPWMRLASFAIWQPGRDPASRPRTQDEEDYLYHECGRRPKALRRLRPRRRTWP
eukprot:1297488-Lingulodinium_polyedra.AAC.1